MSNEIFEKLAYELGKQAALEKNAFLPLLGAAGRAIGRAIGSSSSGLTKLFGSAGKSILKSAPAESSLGKALRTIAYGTSKPAAGVVSKIPRDMATFALLGAPIGALSDPENRWRGALKGTMAGAASGLGWGAGANLARAGQLKLLTSAYGKGGARKIQQMAGKKLFTGKGLLGKKLRKGITPQEAAKTLGLRAGLGIAPVAGMFAGSSLLASPFEGSELAPAPTPYPAPYPVPYPAGGYYY